MNQIQSKEVIVGDLHKQMSNDHNSFSHTISLTLGIGCIILGILFTRILGYLVTADSTSARLVIFVSQIIILGIGLYLVIRRPTILLANALLACGSFALALVLGIVMCQILLPPVTSGWRGFAKSWETNQLGYRGRPIEYSNQDYVVLLLGDSQVEALQCAFAYMPESRLEYYLNSKGKRVKVFSVERAVMDKTRSFLH